MRYSWLLILLLGGFAGADTRADISREYQRSTEASGLKFLDGVYSIRAPKFRLFNMEGLQLDLLVERQRWERVLQPALKVEEKLDIKSLAQPGPDRAICDVLYTTKLYVVDRLTDKQEVETLITGCQDEWVLLNSRWRLLTTHVTRQEFMR